MWTGTVCNHRLANAIADTTETNLVEDTNLRLQDILLSPEEQSAGFFLHHQTISIHPIFDYMDSAYGEKVETL